MVTDNSEGTKVIETLETKNKKQTIIKKKQNQNQNKTKPPKPQKPTLKDEYHLHLWVGRPLNVLRASGFTG